MIDSTSFRKKTGILLIAMVVTVTMTVNVFRLPAMAASNVKIGEATSDERGKTRGGKAGDQRGGEVSMSSWDYSSKNGVYNNWKYVIRAKDPATAKKMAAAMKAACNNNHIGYDQQWPDRVSFHDEAKKLNWNIAGITKDCETTCAQAVAVCINAAGIKVDRYWDSGLVVGDLKKTGKFNFYTDSAHTASSKKLEPGDILLSPGKHTAMVVQSPNAAGAEAASKKKTTTSTVKASATSTPVRITYKKGKTYKTTVALNVRKGPGVNYGKVLRSKMTRDGRKHAFISKYGILKKGTQVTCLETKGDWMKIPSGWICCREGNSIYIR